LDYDSRKILTDVDGVLLDWEGAFDDWMEKEGYSVNDKGHYKQATRYGIEQELADKLVKTFNECAWIVALRPLRDAVDVVQEMLAENYHFECITSLSTDHWAGELRRHNLERHFGRSAMRRIRCIGTGDDKDDILAEYEKSFWWVEDKPDNALAGLEAGHKCILIDHPYNRWFNHTEVKRAMNWKEVFEIIKAE
tara:strand:- start:936 stop:1517 length:582 start_codon:yes stop_codon:yes gene_type:complete